MRLTENPPAPDSPAALMRDIAAGYEQMRAACGWQAAGTKRDLRTVTDFVARSGGKPPWEWEARDLGAYATGLRAYNAPATIWSKLATVCRYLRFASDPAYEWAARCVALTGQHIRPLSAAQTHLLHGLCGRSPSVGRVCTPPRGGFLYTPASRTPSGLQAPGPDLADALAEAERIALVAAAQAIVDDARAAARGLLQLRQLLAGFIIFTGGKPPSSWQASDFEAYLHALHALRRRAGSLRAKRANQRALRYLQNGLPREQMRDLGLWYRRAEGDA